MGELNYWKFCLVLCKSPKPYWVVLGEGCVMSQPEYRQSDQVNLTLWNMPDQCWAQPTGIR